ncbi:MAG: DUF2161 domain-containing phosphodiesterase [Chloroflexota bacterium]
MPRRRETDLYPPVKALLEAQGYTVRAEVNGCDVAAVRDDELIIIELKAGFTLPLLLQGVERQRLSDSVYLAFEAPRGWWRTPRRDDIQRLCRRLGLGLMAITFHRSGPVVEVVCDPGPYQPQLARKRKAMLLKEFAKRSGDHNQGGSSKRPLVTAYRENALLVAEYLKRHGPAAPRAIKAAIGVTNAASILQKDYYGWFERAERGVYRLAPKGEQALDVYADVLGALAAAGATAKGAE